jgi:hypothetical protein
VPAIANCSSKELRRGWLCQNSRCFSGGRGAGELYESRWTTTDAATSTSGEVPRTGRTISKERGGERRTHCGSSGCAVQLYEAGRDC